jgi:thiol:disulfide interchange protein/DsbC/DsbD-like thiol-disulfide interchange protein
MLLHLLRLSFYLFALALAAAPAGAQAAAAATPAAGVTTEHVEAELVAEKATVEPGKPFTVALRIKHAPHWHTYWRNPGDSGLPTKIAWNLPEGYLAGAIQWPHPGKLPLGPLMNFGYEGEVFLLTEITPPATLKAVDQVNLAAQAEWLVCKDVCIPENGDFTLTLAASATPGDNSRWWSDFASARAAHPAQLNDWKLGSSIQGNEAQIRIAPPASFKGTLSDLTFFPFRDNVIENAAPQKISRSGSGYILAITLAQPVPADLKELPGVLVSPAGWGGFAGRAIQVGVDPGQPAVKLMFSASVAPAAASTAPPSDLGLWLALVSAFVGGLILNLMPCVFPVLGIKVMGFVGQARNSSRLLRVQGVIFLAGVVVSFWVLAGLLLALRAGGEALGWGFQMQSPGFVTALAILFLLMALNLSGVFEIGMRLQNVGGDVNAKGVYAEAFLSGVLASVVATPCTAPFMGSALGFTLSQPVAVSFLVFTALAFGMAAPVVLLAFFPAGRKWLPKPGPWMATFKQFMAFPLFATVVWLAWVLGAQRGNDAVMQLLAGLLLVAMAAWVYGRWGMRGSKFAYLATLCLLAGGIIFAWPDSSQPPAANSGASDYAGAARPGELPWRPWSSATLAQLRAEGKPVFVDFTAAWCITCQVNKRIALHRDEVVTRFAELGVVPLKADWTMHDPAITAALAEFGRNAVPLYVLYGGDSSAQPVVLPELLTPTLVLAELAKLKPRIQTVRAE